MGDDPAHGSTPSQPSELLDLLTYGARANPGIDISDPDRVFDYRIDRRLGLLDGKPGRWWTINGHQFPDVPMFMVEEGDVVVMRIENHSGVSHPMHLHGHHALALSRDGTPSTGTPWWVGTLEVGIRESWEIASRADNPGSWMDHCHNLPHAAEGLVAHLMYAGVASSRRLLRRPQRRDQESPMPVAMSVMAEGPFTVDDLSGDARDSDESSRVDHEDPMVAGSLGHAVAWS